MTITVECNVEPTKSDKWKRLAPKDSKLIGPVNVKADQVNGNKTATVIVKL